MKLQIISDFHAEFYRNNELEDALKRIPIVGDTIALCGDICSSERFDEIFPKIVDYFKSVQVVMIPGNHEYYGWVKSEDLYHSIRKFESDKFRILQNEVVVINGQRFVGSTMIFFHSGIIYPEDYLWSDFMFIRDLHSWINLEHTKSIQFLKDNIQKNDVVLTHYIPHYKGIHPKWIGNPNNKYFFTHAAHNIAETCEAKLWAHGHTHCSMDYVINNTRFICNPVGYPHEYNKDFIKDLVIEV